VGDRAFFTLQQSERSGGQHSQSTDLGWGSSIEVAANRALRRCFERSDYAAAVSHAERAAKAAPQNAELWFLLGLPRAWMDAIRLQLTPTTEAFSASLTQREDLRAWRRPTQDGADEEASTTAAQVVAANPKDANSFELAGRTSTQLRPQAGSRAAARADTLHVRT